MRICALPILMNLITLPVQAITVGGMYVTADQEEHARNAWLNDYPDGSQLFLRMGPDNEYYLAPIKDPETGLYTLGFQKTPYYITMHHSAGSDTITLDLPSLKDSDKWTPGPWKIIPQHASLGPRLLLWHTEKNGYLRADDDFTHLSLTQGDDRTGNVSFWYYGSRQTPYVFAALTNGIKVKIQSNDNKSYISYQRIPAPLLGKGGRPLPTLIQPTKAVIRASSTPQIYEIQTRNNGETVYFMPPDSGKPGTRTTPGFGPFKIVPIDFRTPQLGTVYLQNALEPNTYVRMQSDGIVVTNANEPTSLAIIVE